MINGIIFSKTGVMTHVIAPPAVVDVTVHGKVYYPIGIKIHGIVNSSVIFVIHGIVHCPDRVLIRGIIQCPMDACMDSRRRSLPR